MEKTAFQKKIDKPYQPPVYDQERGKTRMPGARAGRFLTRLVAGTAASVLAFGAAHQIEQAVHGNERAVDSKNRIVYDTLAQGASSEDAHKKVAAANAAEAQAAAATEPHQADIQARAHAQSAETARQVTEANR